MVELLAVKADLGVWEDARSFIERTVSEYGRVDVLNEANAHGIKVSIFAPAAIHTPWAEKAGITLPPDSRFLEAQDVADVIRFCIETAEHLNIWNLDAISREQVIDPI